MQPRDEKPIFVGPLAGFCAGLYTEKRALGYRYRSCGRLLKELDRFSLAQCPDSGKLSREFVLAWIKKRPNERPRNQKFRIDATRQLAMYMIRQGAEAYVLPSTRMPFDCGSFTPYVFSHEQVRALLDAADKLRPCPCSPHRHLVTPAMFRILYGCGLRASEVCRLRVQDVDLADGLLTIRATKFDKDRLVPMAPSLTRYLCDYRRRSTADTSSEAYFFPAPDRGPFGCSALYGTFRTLLRQCGISHGGTGRGPRLHDLRHTFAVHCLGRWVREGKNISAALPILSTYLGHNTLYGTQRYLRLTAELFPDITADVEAQFGSVIPERSKP